MFSLISNIHTLQDFKIMLHFTLQDIIKIIVPEAELHRLMQSHRESDVNKMEIDMVQQLAVVMFYSEKKQKQKARERVNTGCLLFSEIWRF